MFYGTICSLDIASPDRTGSFFKIKSISCHLFDFSGLGTGSLRCERILALLAATALFVTAACERQKEWYADLNSASQQR
jgi:hypothetical protein